MFYKNVRFILALRICICVNFCDGRGAQVQKKCLVFSCIIILIFYKYLLLCWHHANSCNIIIYIFTLIKYISPRSDKSILNFFLSEFIASVSTHMNKWASVYISFFFFMYDDLFIYLCVFVCLLFCTIICNLLLFCL